MNERSTMQRNPAWWSDQHTSTWERVKDAMKRDWEQTKADLTGGKSGNDLKQEVGDTVKQASGKEYIPPTDVPNWKPDNFDDVQPAYRYGAGLSKRYADRNDWDADLERDMANDWSQIDSANPWDRARPYVYRGWLTARRSDRSTSGKVGWALLWLLGVPLPVLLILYFIRGH